jgi:hypothetical protein
MKRKPVTQGAAFELDFNMLDGRYALKGAPDLTIVRIEALEKLTKSI